MNSDNDFLRGRSFDVIIRFNKLRCGVEEGSLKGSSCSEIWEELAAQKLQS